jgi:hypothetical protein
LNQSLPTTKTEYPPLPDSFARSGFFARRVGDAAITRFQVLGERSSGTNLIKRLLGQNSTLTPTEALGWKHGFLNPPSIPADFAVVCMVRNSENWARSMYSKPWHTTPEMQALAFSDFLRAPWTTIIDDPRYFRKSAEADAPGQPLLPDLDPATGTAFANLFALRQAKLRSLLGFVQRRCSCVVLRMEDLQDDPEFIVRRVLDVLGQPELSEPFKPVYKRLGSRFKPAVPDRPKPPKEMSPEDRAFMRAQLDLGLEGELGYSY